MFKKAVSRFLSSLVMTCMFLLGLSSLALADTTDPVGSIFTAFNVTGLQSNILTLLLAGVGIVLTFVGYKYFKKAANRM